MSQTLASLQMKTVTNVYKIAYDIWWTDRSDLSKTGFIIIDWFKVDEILVYGKTKKIKK